MTEPELTVLLVLAGVALVAGCVDAIAGGGGLITVPALILAGLDPVAAIATNKVQGTVGVASATAAFARARLIDWRGALPLAGLAFLGSIAGAYAVRHMPKPLLEALIPLLLVGVALYFALSPRAGDAEARARIGTLAFALTVPPLVGFYDGLFGPGAGSFYMLAFVTLMGFSVVRATANTKLLNLASNLGSLLFYAAAGTVVWKVGLAMALSAFVGAQIGSRLAMRLGARLIRPLLIGVCCALALRLLADPANPLRRWAAGLLGP